MSAGRCGSKTRSRLGQNDAPVRNAERQIGEPDCRVMARNLLDMRRLGSEHAGSVDRGIESRQPVEHRLEIGERRIIGDEEVQGFVDASEGLRRLRHDAKFDLAGKVKGSRDDIRNERTDLAVARGEHHELLAALDDRHVIAEDPR